MARIGIALVLCLGIAAFTLTRTVYYVSPLGNDANPGTETRPLQHISEAVRRIPVGGTIYLLPGVYRETADIPPRTGLFTGIAIRGITNRAGSAVISGADEVPDTSWAPCTPETCPAISPSVRPHVYTAPWVRPLRPTRMTQHLSDAVRNLTPARAPDIRADDSAKNWWAADPDAQDPSSLTDTKNDPGVQSGNLTRLPDVTGGTAMIMDGNSRCGTFLYEQKIAKDIPSQGTIMFSRPTGAVTYGVQENGIGAHTRFYLTDAPGLLSSPGEWYFDPAMQRMYVWPFEDKAPAIRMEIAVRPVGLRINASHIRVSDIAVRDTNDLSGQTDAVAGAVVIGTVPRVSVSDVTLSDIRIRGAGNGITVRPPDSAFVTGLTFSRIDITDTAKSAVVLTAKRMAPANVKNAVLSHMTISRTGLRYNQAAIAITRVPRVRLFENLLFRNASYGIHISGYEDKQTAVSDIEVTGNRIEKSCTNAASCSALKFFGGHFLRSRASGNVLADTVAWSVCESAPTGAGLFVSNASGISAYRNRIIRNGAYGIVVYPRQFQTTHNEFTENTIDGSPVGIALITAEGEADNDPAVFASRHDRTVIKKNGFFRVNVGLDVDPASPRSVTIRDNTFDDVATALTVRMSAFLRMSDVTRVFPFWR